ncbi:hypothetical protein CSAL01_09381 [Colletotrichum salicis]|uniref:Uncharacterized protein n=1 Tax=Colletotrichum salicis TaxID=1209931 RepID=A0A135V278_9PEZI|nr:hypothetical protein CSAL01_09381 [Colletotrichum salicis]
MRALPTRLSLLDKRGGDRKWCGVGGCAGPQCSNSHPTLKRNILWGTREEPVFVRTGVSLPHWSAYETGVLDGMGSGGVPEESMPLCDISATFAIKQEGGRPADVTETQFRLGASRRLIGSR